MEKGEEKRGKASGIEGRRGEEEREKGQEKECGEKHAVKHELQPKTLDSSARPSSLSQSPWTPRWPPHCRVFRAVSVLWAWRWARHSIILGRWVLSSTCGPMFQGSTNSSTNRSSSLRTPVISLSPYQVSF